jgi:hypothetical protein
MHVLLRAWPDQEEPGDERVAREFLIEYEGPLLKPEQPYYIEVLGYSAPVLRVLEASEHPRADAEIHFEDFPQSAMRMLKDANWELVDCPCPTCPPKR